MRVRYRHRIAERHLDALAGEMQARGWARLKLYVESPPVLFVYADGNEESALSIAATNTGGQWVFQTSRLIEYPCEAVIPVANILSDVLRDRMPDAFR
ncbi:hypothetical protein [Spirillospora sp. NPDC048824]|uniref:hypothetical protein n=1 Tax=Spirillospora sp. NPDC048824 TaxID=3364526 RepID=UPI0037225BE3